MNSLPLNDDKSVIRSDALMHPKEPNLGYQ